MNDSMNRRDWLRTLGLTGSAAGLGTIAHRSMGAAAPGESSGFQSSVIAPAEVWPQRASPSLVDGKVMQPARELPVLHTTDVLVVGGGPAGICAALAAKRCGADVTIVERYGHFGGLWTGGLVLLIVGHIIKGGQQVCQGLGEEIMRRLDKMPGAIVDRRPGVAPTVDAEAVKYLMVEMIEECQAKVFLHCWGVDAIVNNQAVQGVSSRANRGDRPSWPRSSSMLRGTATCLPRLELYTNVDRTTWVWFPVSEISTVSTPHSRPRARHQVTWEVIRPFRVSIG